MNRITFQIHRFDVLDSTNSTAREWIAGGAPEGTVLVAREQRSGRGRQGRTWCSLPGALLFSLILRPRFPADLLPRIGFYACVSAALAAERSGLPRAWLKWPNDLVLPAEPVHPGRAASPTPWTKWGGVLVETGFSADRSPWAVVGIGLNVGSLAGMDEARLLSCTSLEDALGYAISADTVLESLLQQFVSLYDSDGGDWKGTLSAWRTRDILYGRTLRAQTIGGSSGGWVEGRAQGIDDDGSLILTTPSGPVRIEAGDVHLSG